MDTAGKWKKKWNQMKQIYAFLDLKTLWFTDYFHIYTLYWNPSSVPFLSSQIHCFGALIYCSDFLSHIHTSIHIHHYLHCSGHVLQSGYFLSGRYKKHSPVGWLSSLVTIWSESQTPSKRHIPGWAGANNLSVNSPPHPWGILPWWVPDIGTIK